MTTLNLRKLTAFLSFGILSMGTFANHAYAIEWRVIPYQGLHEAFSQVPNSEGQYLQFYKGFVIDSDTFSVADLQVEILSATGVIPVNIDASGKTDFPLTPQLLEENPDVRTNAPAGELGAAIQMAVTAPPMQSFSYQLLLDMEAEYNAFVDEQGFIARMAMPDATAMNISFDPASTAPIEVKVAGKTTPLTQAADGGYLLPLTNEWRELRPSIELSMMPASLSLELE